MNRYGYKTYVLAASYGPGGFRELREACRNHFQSCLSDSVVPSYGQKLCRGYVSVYGVCVHYIYVCLHTSITRLYNLMSLRTNDFPGWSGSSRNIQYALLGPYLVFLGFVSDLFADHSPNKQHIQIPHI